MRRGLVLYAGLARLGRCDFAYVDFNSTQGLRFNGAAATSACEVVEARSFEIRGRALRGRRQVRRRRDVLEGHRVDDVPVPVVQHVRDRIPPRGGRLDLRGRPVVPRAPASPSRRLG